MNQTSGPQPMDQKIEYTCQGCGADLLLDLDKDPKTIDFVVCKSCHTPAHKDCAQQYGCTTYACKSKQFYTGAMEKNNSEIKLLWVDETGKNHELTDLVKGPAPLRSSRQEAILEAHRQRVGSFWSRLYRRVCTGVAVAAVVSGGFFGFINFAEVRDAEKEYDSHVLTREHACVQNSHESIKDAIACLTYKERNPVLYSTNSGEYDIDWSKFPAPSKARNALKLGVYYLKNSKYYRRPDVEKSLEDIAASVKDKVQMEVDVGKHVKIMDYVEERKRLAEIETIVSKNVSTAECLLPKEITNYKTRALIGGILGLLGGLSVLVGLLYSKRDE